MRDERQLCSPGDNERQTLPKTAAVQHGESIDAAIARQREDWVAGIRIPIADRLKAWEGNCSDPDKAAELIYYDFLLRRESGETPEWDSVLGGFPQYAAQLQHFREADEIVESALAPLRRPSTHLSDYDLLEEVGRGGMGVVYRARERNLDRCVAIKRIRASALADDDVIQRFLKEAKAVSRLNHPNIVHVYRVSDSDEEPFIALEFVEGPTLAQRIGGTPLAPRVAGAISAAVARAIQHAHEHGIVHRDLKPANILLSGPSDSPVPKVTDFGAAKELDHASAPQRTQFLGTPSYMAPEQAEPKWGRIDRVTDVYGIGAILYEALTGRAPFRADSVSETLRQVAETEPVSPRLLNVAVPRDLETICLKCLHKEPGRRYESATALADDLERFLAGQPILARPLGPATRAWMWCRRKPGTAGLVAVLLLVLLGGTGGITLQWQRAELARQSALASDVEAQQLLGELITSIPVVPGRGYRPVAPSVDSLLRAEAHCRNLLQKNPGEIELRIALSKVYGRLGTLSGERGQLAEAEENFRQARALWEPLASEVHSNAVCWDWLATTYFWQAAHGDNDTLRLLQSTLRAEAIWQKLADEQPDNLDLMQKIWECRVRMTGLAASRVHRDNCVRLIDESRTELERSVRQNPADRVLRKRLALRCFLLGEIYAYNPSAGKAPGFWRESYEHYSILTKERRVDLLGNILLAVSCSRLIQGQPTDPYYLQSVPLLEQAGRRLVALLDQQPQSDRLREMLLEDYCCLTLCHVKAGQTAKAEQASNHCVGVLSAPLEAERIEPAFALGHATKLNTVAQLLREARQPAAAVRLARQVAALSSQLAVYPSHDPGFLDRLSHALTDSSALASQLGEPDLAFQQAELARRVIQEWIRVTPDDVWPESMLSIAWMRIAKARWSLSERDQALAAFRESAAIQKRIFEREPSNHFYRAALSQDYDRLVFYGVRGGNLRGAAEAILERTRLWPDNAQQLAKSADDFSALAKQVTARGRSHLSAEDQAERDRYLAESRRIRQSAQAASRQSHPDLRVER